MALTYTDKVDNEVLNELSVLGHALAKKYLINYNNYDVDGFKKNLQYYLNLSSLTGSSSLLVSLFNFADSFNWVL